MQRAARLPAVVAPQQAVRAHERVRVVEEAKCSGRRIGERLDRVEVRGAAAARLVMVQAEAVCQLDGARDPAARVARLPVDEREETKVPVRVVQQHRDVRRKDGAPEEAEVREPSQAGTVVPQQVTVDGHVQSPALREADVDAAAPAQREVRDHDGQQRREQLQRWRADDLEAVVPAVRQRHLVEPRQRAGEEHVVEHLALRGVVAPAPAQRLPVVLHAGERLARALAARGIVEQHRNLGLALSDCVGAGERRFEVGAQRAAAGSGARAVQVRIEDCGEVQRLE